METPLSLERKLLREEEEVLTELKNKHADGTPFDDAEKEAILKSEESLKVRRSKIVELQEADTKEYQERLDSLFAPRPVNDTRSTHEWVRSKSKITPELIDQSFMAWAKSGSTHVSTKELRAADACNVNVQCLEYVIRNQSSDISGEGKEWTDDASGLHQGLIEGQKAFGGFETLARQLITPNGNDVKYSLTDDVAPQGDYQVQNTNINNDNLVVSDDTLHARLLTGGIFPVSIFTFEDAVNFDASKYIGEQCGRRLARKEAYDALHGNPAGSPPQANGILNDIGVGSHGISNALIEGDITDLYKSIDNSYRKSPKCAWVMNSNTLVHLATIKDADTGYKVWGDGLNSAIGATLLGHPVVVIEDMDSMSPGVERYPIFFGDFNYLVQRRVRGERVIVKDVSTFAQKLAVGFYAYQRWDQKLYGTDFTKPPVLALVTGESSGA